MLPNLVRLATVSRLATRVRSTSVLSTGRSYSTNSKDSLNKELEEMEKDNAQKIEEMGAATSQHFKTLNTMMIGTVRSAAQKIFTITETQIAKVNTSAETALATTNIKIATLETQTNAIDNKMKALNYYLVLAGGLAAAVGGLAFIAFMNSDSNKKEHNTNDDTKRHTGEIALLNKNSREQASQITKLQQGLSSVEKTVTSKDLAHDVTQHSKQLAQQAAEIAKLRQALNTATGSANVNIVQQCGHSGFFYHAEHAILGATTAATIALANRAEPATVFVAAVGGGAVSLIASSYSIS